MRPAVTVVIFASVHGAGRSQMAAAFFNADADPKKARAISVGTDPARRVHPEVVAAMRDVGIDVTTARPRKLTDEMAANANLLVTMGCGEACPFAPGLRADWNVPDPEGQPPERVRAIRDDVRVRVQRLIAAERWQRK